MFCTIVHGTKQEDTEIEYCSTSSDKHCSYIDKNNQVSDVAAITVKIIIK